MPSSFALRLILDPLQDSCSDCDGMSRLYHYVLTELGIPHAMIVGSVHRTDTNEGMAPHFWIQVILHDKLFIIDYRARKWIGESEEDETVPHGIFRLDDFPNIVYEGQASNEPPLPAGVIAAMIQPF